MPNFPGTIAADASMLKAENFVVTTLRGAMTNVQTTCPVNDASRFPNPAGATYYAVIDAATTGFREIIGYTGRDLTGGANALTGVTRGVDPAFPGIAHNSGVSVELTDVAAFHELLKTEIIAVQTKVGVDGSATNTTHDYKLAQVATGDRAVSLTGTQTLTNKTLTSPVIQTGMTVGGNIIMSSASAKLVQGPTDWMLRNNGDTQSNMHVTDAGVVTFRAAVGGITTLTATSLVGTLNTAAQPNITSVGTLTSLTVSGTTTLSDRVVAVANLEVRGLNESKQHWMDF